MRKLTKYLATFVASLLLFVCLEHRAVIAGALEKQQRFEASLLSWQLVKKQIARYQYSVNFSSWVGFSNRTTLSVEDDVVVNRAYVAFDQNNKLVAQWQEDGSDEIGTHKRGATPKTMDQLYRQCRSEVLSKSAQENYISLSFDENNLLRQCTYTPMSCADDCSFGVNISDLQFNQTP